MEIKQGLVSMRACVRNGREPKGSRSSRIWPVVAAFGLMLAACASGSTSSSITQSQTTVQTTGQSTTSASTTSVAQSGETTTTADPNQVFGSEEFGLTMDQLAAKIDQVEGLVGDCMREAGFEYVPVDFVTVRAAMTSDKSKPGLSDEAFRSQYGYGISTQTDKPSVSIGFGEQNQRIYNNLAPTDQVAYKQTLYGENKEATFAVTLEAEDFSTTGGCTRKAVEQSFTPEELSATYFNPGDRRIEQDPRVVAAIAAWSDCMRQAGFAYDHPDAIEDDFRERFNAITQGQDPTTLTGGALDELVQLQGEEKAVAQADFTCADQLLEPVIAVVEAEIYGAPQP